MAASAAAVVELSALELEVFKSCNCSTVQDLQALELIPDHFAQLACIYTNKLNGLRLKKWLQTRFSS